MKFRNVTTDDLHVPSLGVVIPAGGTTDDLTDEQAEGWLHQVNGNFSPVGAEAKAAQKEAVEAEPTTEETSS